MYFRALITLLLAAFAISSCSKDPAIPNTEVISLNVPKGFPNPVIPEYNQITQAKIKLGKALFYEKSLSRDSSTSCASCHFQFAAFADPNRLSTGVDGRQGFRNSQALFNLAWKPDFFRDGGVQSLELTTLNPLHSNVEFDSNTSDMIRKLKSSSYYVRLFREAFNDTIGLNNTLFAIATFQRTLISGNSRYDRYQYHGEELALSETEKRGMQIFFSEQTNCSACHSGFNFSKQGYFANGLFPAYPDSGRQRITLLETDRNKFSIPSLRNIEYTAPYMHNGEYSSLEEVVDAYNSGGFNVINKDSFIRPLGLTADEKADLISFLKSLSDEEFISNSDFQPDND
jgi:cytochrome c peroxidase